MSAPKTQLWPQIRYVAWSAVFYPVFWLLVEKLNVTEWRGLDWMERTERRLRADMGRL